MPIHVSRDDVHRRLTLTARDPVTPSDCRTVLADQAEMGLWTYGTLHDTRAVTSSMGTLAAAQMTTFLDALTVTYGRHGPIAVVVRDEEPSNIERLHGVSLATLPLTLKVFTTIGDAEEWLDRVTTAALL